MSDGQFSSKPMRTGRSRDMAITANASPGDTGGLPAPEARDFLQSSVVRQEVDALMEYPYPRRAATDCAPLRPDMPSAATSLGKPIASAALVQEYLIGLVFLRLAGWLFLPVGALLVLGSLFGFLGSLANQAAGAPAPWIFLFTAGFGLFVGGAGVWFGIVRGRVITEMCWFCPRGMIWMTEGQYDWYGWEEVTELYFKRRAVRPAVGLRFDGDVGWITFSNTEDSRQVLDLIDNRAAAACIQAILKLLSQGGQVRFGSWRMSLSFLYGPQGTVAWHDVVEVFERQRELLIRHRERGNMDVDLDEVPFPSLFMTVARCLHGQARA